MGRVVVTNGQGEFVTIDAATLAEAERAGWHPQTPEDVAAREAEDHRRRYSGWKQTALSAVEALNRGVSLGLSDVYARAAGYGEDVAGRRSANPVVATAGELVGSVGPALATGGTSIAAKALAATPAGQIARLGTAAATSAEASLAARGAAGVAARALPAVAAGAVEGYGYGVGTGISEAALSAQDLEQAASTIGSHALLGTAYGAGASLAIAGASEVARALRRPAGRLATAADADAAQHAVAAHPDLAAAVAAEDRRAVRLAREQEQANLRATRAADEGLIQARQKAELDRLAALRKTEKTQLADEIRAVRDESRGPRRGREGALPDVLNDWPGNAAPDQETRAILNKVKRSFESLVDVPQRLAEDPRRAMDTLERLETGLTKVVDFGPQLRKEVEAGVSQLPQARAALARQTEVATQTTARVESLRGIEQAAKRAARGAPAGDPNISAWNVARLERVNAERVAKREVATFERLQRTVKHLETAGGEASFGQTRLASLANAERLLPRVQDLRARIRAAYEPPASPALDALAKEHEIWRAKTYTSERMAAVGAAEDLLAPQRIGFGTRLAQGATMAGVMSISHGLGAISLPIASAAAMLVGRLARRGGAVGGRMAAAAELFGDIARVAKRVTPATTAILGTARFAPREKREREIERPQGEPAAVKHLLERERELRRQVDANGSITLEARTRIHEALAPLWASSSKLADKAEALAVRKIEFLAARLPRRVGVTSAMGGPDRWRPSDMEIARFGRLVAAVEDPAGVAERLAAGNITPEDAEALRTVYPEMYADLVRRILEKVGKLKEPLPYPRRLSLSILTGAPVEASMDPQIVAFLQSTHEQEEPAPPARPSLTKLNKPEPTAAQQRAG